MILWTMPTPSLSLLRTTIMVYDTYKVVANTALEATYVDGKFNNIILSFGTTKSSNTMAHKKANITNECSIGAQN